MSIGDRGVPSGMGRRSFLISAALLAAACGTTNNVVTVRLGSGREGGLFHEIAQLMAAVATESDTVRIEPVVTAGSLVNLELIERGDIDAALALADSVFDSETRALAIGRLYEGYLHLAVLANSPVRQVGDLRGRRVDLGVVGSGAAMAAERALRVAGLDPAVDLTVDHRQLSDAVTALYTGATDAIMWAGGLPAPDVDVPRRVRLIEMGELVVPMRERYGYHYDLVEIPTDAYPGSSAVHTIGVPSVLLAGPALADSAVSAIADLLLQRADGLVPQHARGFQFLDSRWLTGTGGVPLHPAAAERYRRWHG